MANALKEIEHAQRLCDRGDITIGEYFDLVKKWEDAEPTKHGRWILNSQYGTECSECGMAMFEIVGAPYTTFEPNYCPNCGTRMDGGENE